MASLMELLIGLEQDIEALERSIEETHVFLESREKGIPYVPESKEPTWDELLLGVASDEVPTYRDGT